MKVNLSQKGQNLVEYALLLLFIVLAIVGVLSIVAPNIGNVFSEITQQLESEEITQTEKQPTEEEVATTIFEKAINMIFSKPQTAAAGILAIILPIIVLAPKRAGKVLNKLIETL